MNMKNHLKHLLGRHPGLFVPVYRRLAPGRIVDECLIGPDKELVIEGFPRSANTFAVVAFRLAQGRRVPIAHHLHIEAQILTGVARGLPVVAVIRNPADAITSLAIRHPETDITWALRRYIQFYEAVERVSTQVVIGGFDEVTTDFGATIRRVNDHFGTRYAPFEHTPANEATVFAEIERINEMVDGGQETHVARPSAHRTAIRDRVVIPDGPLLRDALALFDALTSRG